MIPPPSLAYQGAEALLYRTTFFSVHQSVHAALKFRPAKPYRHPVLDAKLTRHRILQEARVLVKLRREGVSVPAVYALDWEAGWIVMEWIDGLTVRKVLDDSLHEFLRLGDEQQKSHRLWALMGRIGRLVGKMHESGVVHGDMTTSNLMLRGVLEDDNTAFGEAVLIDFGLAAQSVQDEEDRAVDLYVLERAFGSTHPQTERLFKEVLRAYEASYKSAKGTLRKTRGSAG